MSEFVDRHFKKIKEIIKKNKTMSQVNPDGYTNVAFYPSKHDTYLVKTQEGTYEFAFFDGDFWTIKGDNSGAKVSLWRPIPQTDEY